jgi:hypothetical protein
MLNKIVKVHVREYSRANRGKSAIPQPKHHGALWTVTMVISIFFIAFTTFIGTIVPRHTNKYQEPLSITNYSTKLAGMEQRLKTQKIKIAALKVSLNSH